MITLKPPRSTTTPIVTYAPSANWRPAINETRVAVWQQDSNAQTIGSLPRAEALHTGHSAFWSSHLSMHSWWNLWKHGTIFRVSPSSKSHKHTMHEECSSPALLTSSDSAPAAFFGALNLYVGNRFTCACDAPCSRVVGVSSSRASNAS